MSTFTKEQLIEQAKKNIEVLRGAAERIPGASDAAVIHLKLAEITLASLEAEPVGYFGRFDADDEDLIDQCSHNISGAFPLYSAPPAPVSVPEWTNEQCLEFLSIAFRHAEIKGDLELDDIRLGVKMANGSRAAMLQGADNELQRKAAIHDALCQKYSVESLADFVDWQRNHITELEAAPPAPVGQGEPAVMPDYPGYVMTQRECFQAGAKRAVPDGWVAVPIEPTEDMIVNGFESEPNESFSDEKEWEEYEAMSGCQQAAHRAKLCWAAMLAAAPRPEA